MKVKGVNTIVSKLVFENKFPMVFKEKIIVKTHKITFNAFCEKLTFK
jgi:hypothetical protein